MYVMATATNHSTEQWVASNTDKIYWPKEKYTKGNVLDYYNSVYKYIIKHLKGRPQSLFRTPNGINGASFFHKDAGEHVPEWVDTYPMFSESAHKTVDYIVCNNKKALQYIVNLGCIEINPWSSRVTAPDYPDYAILDLDPSSKNTFNEVITCAQVIKSVLDKAGITGYPKTSGATGIHIYIPLGGKYNYEQARQFTELIAHLTHDQIPGFTSLERSLSKRGNNIYIDYLQNKLGATLATVYSLRPKPGAPVSMALEWKEVKDGLLPLNFTINNALKRIEKKGDIFLPVLGKGIDMNKALKNLKA